MFNSINFEYPYFFALIFLFIICDVYCKARVEQIYVPHLKILQKSSKKSSFLIITLKYLVVIFSLIALCSPIKVDKNLSINSQGINIVLNLDASSSMKLQDLDPNKNRFDVAKDIVKDFISKRTNDNIALVLFGDWAFLASPLSFDKNSQNIIIDYLEVEMAGKRTALYDSIIQSINILKNKKAKSNIIIVLSDGEDNNSKIPIQITTKLLKKYDIKVYTIAIGEFDSFALQDISKQTNAKSYIASSKEHLQKIYNEINNLEKSQIEQSKIEIKEYLFFYPLFLATLTLVILIYFKNKE